MAHVYRITNKITGRIYIGKEKNFDPKYLGSGMLITAAIEKYGRENFIKDILEECSLDSIDAREKYWIETLNSTERDIGYNIALGGSGGDTTTNHPDRDSIVNKRKQGIKRWHDSMTFEEKEKWKNNISANRKGNFREGIKQSAETCAKRSATLTGRIRSEAEIQSHRKAMALRKGHIPGNSKKVEINGIIYATKKQAYRDLKIYKVKLDKMIEKGEAKYVD